MKLEKIIEIIEKKLQQMKIYNELNIDNYTILMNKILEIIENKYKILELSSEEIKLLKDVLITEKEYRLLKTYKLILENDNLTLLDESINKLIEICNNIIKKYHEIKDLKDSKEKINSLYERLKDDININANDIEEIYKLLLEYGLTQEEIRDILFDLSKAIYKKVNVVPNEVVIIEEEELNEGIQLEECVKLFKEYGYSFDEFTKENQERILKQGNYSRIKGIFEALKEKVNLKDNNGNLINKKQNCICTILINSNKSIVENIIKICEDNNLYIIDSHGNKVIDFYTMIKEPSKFLLRKKEYALQFRENNAIGQYDIQEVGNYQDFVANITLFKEIAKNTFGDKFDYIAKTFSKGKGDIFTYPNKRIINVIKIFELYGYEPKYYLESPSCFNSIRQADLLDLAIELDFMEYLKNNPSHLMRKTNDPIFYKISMAKYYHYDKIYRKAIRTGITGDKNEKIELNHQGIIDLLTSKGIDIPSECNLSLKPIGKFSVYEDLINRSSANTIDLIKEELSSNESTCSIKLLEENFKVTDNPLIYQIEGYKFSRLKVMRIYNVMLENGINDSIDLLLYALTRGSHINVNDYEKIKTKLEEVFIKEKRI